jgi:hypothetical protein
MKIDIKRDQKLPNLYGMYHDHAHQYRPGKQIVRCYYACKPGKEHVHAPTIGKRYDSIPSIPELQKECEAIARSTRTLRELPQDVIDRVRWSSDDAEEVDDGQQKRSLDLLFSETIDYRL